MSEHIDKKLQTRAEESCIDTRKFEVGTKLFVETESNVYELTFIDAGAGIVFARNGSNWLEEIEVRFNGCTWGGSCLKMGHIGRGMYMEFQYIEDKKAGGSRKSSAVKSCKVVGPKEAWNFELWEDEEDEDTV